MNATNAISQSAQALAAMAPSTAPSAGFVVAQGLTKLYAGRPVVSDVSFELRSGEFLSLLGPSGSGKTTVLRMLAGLSRPDGGIIRIGDLEIFGPRKDAPVEERGLGMVFQDYALWPQMTVEQNIAFGLALRHVPRAERQARVAEMLALVDLTGFERRFPNQLSGGQQQRISLARALATRPRLLLLDEPLASLDTGLREAMREEIVRIVRKTQMTVINVTHDQDEAMVMSDRILLLRHGVAQQFGSPADLYQRPQTAFIARFMGAANLITGIVAGVDGGQATLRRDALTFSGRLGARAFAAGEPAALLCRPEDSLAREAPGDDLSAAPANTLAGVVTRAAFSGGRWRMVVACGSGVEVAVATDRELPVNANVWVTLPPERCLLVVDDHDGAMDLEEGPRQAVAAVAVGTI